MLVYGKYECFVMHVLYVTRFPFLCVCMYTFRKNYAMCLTYLTDSIDDKTAQMPF